MIHIFAQNEADARKFYEMVTTGELPIYGYPNLMERLKAGYVPVHDLKSAEGLTLPALDTLYTPNFANNPRAGAILDAINLTGEEQ